MQWPRYHAGLQCHVFGNSAAVRVFIRSEGKGVPASIGCVCAGLGLSLLSIPDRYEFVLLMVIVSGLGIASFHPEGFKTARSFTGDKMATGLAVFTVGGNLGLALGPLVPTFISRISAWITFR